jgi:predicted NAD-dependent protein-ADP-ribosyltransferase YbiA (DUF1768 family)
MEWIDAHGMAIMREVLHEKLQQITIFRETLSKHKGKKLVDANRNTLWGAGISFTSIQPGATIPKWSGNNKLGKLLAQLSDEL